MKNLVSLQILLSSAVVFGHATKLCSGSFATFTVLGGTLSVFDDCGIPVQTDALPGLEVFDSLNDPVNCEEENDNIRCESSDSEFIRVFVDGFDLKQEILSGQMFMTSSGKCNLNTAFIYKCPNTNFCVSDYFQCNFLNSTCPTSSSTPFKCQETSTGCVSQLSDCCPSGKFLCPHTKTCVSNASSCCSLNPDTPIFCNATQTCVSHDYDCCSNKLKDAKKMVKCSNQDVCMPTDSSDYCFDPFVQTCVDPEFSFFCRSDGTCKRNSTECTSPRVCPPGYTMCPDQSCIPGLASFGQCDSLTTCQQKIPGTSLNVGYIRCPDAKTCTTDIDSCPTQVSCLNSSMVVCPDSTCKKSSYECLEPQTHDQQDLNSHPSCGKNMIRCPNGQCAPSCENHIPSEAEMCLSQGKIQCPISLVCVESYEKCPTTTQCLVDSNFTYSPSTYLCGDGVQNCVTDRYHCQSSGCSSPFAYFDSVIKPFADWISSHLVTCPDGRCAMPSPLSPSPFDSCMTQFSCSSGYQKIGGFGLFCIDKTSFVTATKALELAYLLRTSCPDNFFTCLTGECRSSINDCPQETTCPKEYPIQCRDGQCVSSKADCTSVDKAVFENLKVCVNKKQLLCPSDLITCTDSLQKCPTPSTCPTGFMKCSEGSCVDPTLESCSAIQNERCSTSKPFYCRASGTCTTSLQACSKLITCPSDLPVKCAADQTCKSSYLQCSAPGLRTLSSHTYKDNIQCSETQFTCKSSCSSTPCPEWSKCPVSTDTQCLTGQCVSDATLCPSQTSCYDFLYPNTVKTKHPELSPDTCYIPQCPPDVPLKCPNGLCVTSLLYCPTEQYSGYQIAECSKQSGKSGLNNRIPCADGTCVQNHENCLPLYNCTLNSDLKSRCSDGSCQKNPSDCPISVNTESVIKCSSAEAPFMCATGQCAASSSECIISSNGCPDSLPYRCETHGSCVLKANYCADEFEVLSNLSLMPPSTGQNLCQRIGKVLCFGADNLYCASSLQYCINSNGCSVDKPILCDGNCYSSYSQCQSLSSPLLTASKEVTQQGCPLSTPFRCSTVDQNACKALPYSSYQELNQEACTTGIQSLENRLQMNRCMNALTPYTCDDSSCVADYNQCKTCAYFCDAMWQCVHSKTECDEFNELDTQEKVRVTHLCPAATPVRCKTSGQCVSTPLACYELLVAARSQNYLSTFSGQLLGPKCSNVKPIQCINGNCVEKYNDCFKEVQLTSSVFDSPVTWSSFLNETASPKTCQVYCSDGSCRDRQENCPLIEACSNPLKPHRCKSGFCSDSARMCIQLFGEDIESEEAGIPSPSCMKELETTDLYFRCEDGTCRPGIWEEETKSYTNSCLEFFGCPLTVPFLCPTGQCVKERNYCYLQNTFCMSINRTNPYQCKNLTCVNDLAYCSMSSQHVPALQMEYDLDPLTAHSIDFAYLNSEAIARLVLQENSMPSDLPVRLQKQSLLQVEFTPVPYNEQNTIKTKVSENVLKYLSNYYLISDGAMTSYDSQILPLVRIRVFGQTETLKLLKPGHIEFKIDSATWPIYLRQEKDMCLAFVDSENTWQCESYNFNVTADGFVSFEVSELPKTYSLIISPDPSKYSSTGSSESWWEANKWLVMIAILSVVILILIIIFGICLRRRRQNKDQTKHTITVPEWVEPVQSEKDEEEEEDPSKTLGDVNKELLEENNYEVQLSSEASIRQMDHQKFEKSLQNLKLQEEKKVEEDPSFYNFEKLLRQKSEEIKTLKTKIEELEKLRIHISAQGTNIALKKAPQFASMFEEDRITEKMVVKLQASMTEHYQAEVQRIQNEVTKAAQGKGDRAKKALHDFQTQTDFDLGLGSRSYFEESPKRKTAFFKNPVAPSINRSFGSDQQRDAEFLTDMNFEANKEFAGNETERAQLQKNIENLKNFDSKKSGSQDKVEDFDKPMFNDKEFFYKPPVVSSGVRHVFPPRRVEGQAQLERKHYPTAEIPQPGPLITQAESDLDDIPDNASFKDSPCKHAPPCKSALKNCSNKKEKRKYKVSYTRNLDKAGQQYMINNDE